MNNKTKALSEKFKALGHPVRLTIVERLIKHHSDRCNVNKMSEKLNLPQPTVSQHLSILKRVGIIEAQKDGVNTCYKVIDEQIIRFFK
ncbi:Transcriptional regulator, ArsR family [Chitinispirillum alkaliphilum]|nr:Transcriptional regulator, ArsR family [Chitinispirillum alkaliphilum]